MQEEAARSAGVEIEEIESDEDSGCEYTPESRVETYRELAEQKQEKEDREAERRPRKRDWSVTFL